MKESNVWQCCGFPKTPSKNLTRYDIPQNCPLAYDLISQGNTDGIFQLQSYLGKTWAKRARPRTIREIADLISIIRPGTLDAGLTDEYVQVKHGVKPAEYIHQKLEPILSGTYGVIVYQEQIIEIAKEFAGYTLSEADILRKCVSKKMQEQMEKQQSIFINGCLKNDITKEVAQQLFSWIQKSANYSFNLSHAVSYGITSYHCAWLKAHYPINFIQNMLQFAAYSPNQQQQICNIINDARNNGVVVIPPDVREKNLDFIIKDDRILFGLKHIRGIGASKIEKIKALSRYDNFSHFMSDAVGLNLDKTSVQALVFSGALDFLNLDRHVMAEAFSILRQFDSKQLAVYLKILADKNNDFAQAARIFNFLMDDDMFDDGSLVRKYGHIAAGKTHEKKLFKICGKLIEISPIQRGALLETICRQRDSLGTLVSDKILVFFTDETYSCSRVHNAAINSRFEVIGFIQGFKEFLIKRGKSRGSFLARLNISDHSSSIQCVIFPRQYEQYKQDLQSGVIFKICGKITQRGNIINTVEILKGVD